MQTSRLQFVDRCLSEAITAAHTDRRDLRRYSFFRALTFSHGGGAVPGFCRDVSRTGIGLLHDHPLEVDTLLNIHLPTGGTFLDLACTTNWCSQMGDDLYVSGCRFDALSTAATLSLVTAVVREEFNRRVQQRYPFFRSATLNFHGGVTQPGYCRDISRGGLGLMLRQAVRPGRVLIRVEVANDIAEEISLDIRWCQPAAEGWYLAGGKFSRVWIEETPARLL
jgi:hypothetical protein